ncbi:MAG: FAD-dependent oxidoreductase [Ignavibacteria bacterium]|nr:FAD-dependent oxidoreductase [Ignavibacteria bacterium]
MAKPRLVILGTGFAAFSVIKDIDEELYEVIVVSPRNHFLFTPLLPSTTVGTIEFRSIIEPIRVAKRGIEYHQAVCTNIDPTHRLIQCRQVLDGISFTLQFDLLVIAVGATSNTYNIPGVKEHSLLLRELSDARAIRQRIIDCFERASTPGLGSSERKRLLHFVVVGGGPTGVEFAAELHDFLMEDLRSSYSHLVDDAQVTVLEATDHILGTFDQTLSEYATQHFCRQKIEVCARSTVIRVEPTQVILKDGTVVPFGLLVWSTGIGPSSLVEALPIAKWNDSRIIVDQFLRVQGSMIVYALGDCATIEGNNLPPTAQVARREGKYLARAFNRLAEKKSIEPFQYKDLGMLAYIGGGKALADLNNLKGRGYFAFIFWRSVYLTKLVSPKTKMLVLFDWIKTRIFGRDISRF